MRKVYLYGSLKKYGDVIDLDITTAGEAIVALAANFPDFEKDIRKGNWSIIRGDIESGMSLDQEAVVGLRLGSADIHIMPHVIGAKNGDGMLKVIIGVALVAVSFGSAAFLGAAVSQTLLGATTWGNVIGQLGVAMAISGVSTMLAPEEQSTSNEESFTLSGPTSSTGQGQAIQLVYGGPIITGGMMISGGIDANGLDSVTPAPVVEIDPAAVPVFDYS